MSFIEHDKRLFFAVRDGNMRRAKAALEAGAGVDGSRALPCAPILAATIANRVDMVDFLLQEIADPDRPITEELPHPSLSLDCPIAIPGERALHLASGCGYVDIVRLLLKRSRVDPNATDSEGGTALTATCRSVHACVEVVSLLLEGRRGPDVGRQERGHLPSPSRFLRLHRLGRTVALESTHDAESLYLQWSNPALHGVLQRPREHGVQAVVAWGDTANVFEPKKHVPALGSHLEWLRRRGAGPHQ